MTIQLFPTDGKEQNNHTIEEDDLFDKKSNIIHNVIITGASSGLGKALAIIYSEFAKNILLIGRNKKHLEETKKLCKNANIEIAICDVTDEQKLKKTITDYDQKFPVDLIIANAGISAGTAGGGENLDQIKNIFNTNITGVINSIYPLIDRFKERRKGQIAIISSMSAFRGLPSAPAYSSSKACVKHLGDAIRGDLENYNIKVNVICPGYIKTPMTDANNFPMPFIINAEKAAKIIRNNIARNKPVVIFPKMLYWTISLTKLLPTRLSDRLFSSLPKK